MTTQAAQVLGQIVLVTENAIVPLTYAHVVKAGLGRVVKFLIALDHLTVLGVAHVTAQRIHPHAITAQPAGWAQRVTAHVSTGNRCLWTVATVCATQALWVWVVTASVRSMEKL